MAQRVSKKRFDWEEIVWFKILQNIGDRKEHAPYVTHEEHHGMNTAALDTRFIIQKLLFNQDTHKYK
jgi:hypothetical protein